MAKTLPSMQDLRWRALAEIRKQPRPAGILVSFANPRLATMALARIRN